MKQVIGILLIAAGAWLAYLGYKKQEGSKADIKIGDVEISASDKGSQNDALFYYGGAALLVIGGVVLISQKKKVA